MHPTFPTLAEDVAGGSSSEDAREGTLVVVFEGERDVVSALVPAGSILARVAADGLRTAIEGDGSSDSGHLVAATPEQVLELVRSVAADLLLVSSGFRLTQSVLDGLRDALAEDSGCATVSLDASLGPHVPGIPPQSVPRPGGAAVLVRRDHLLLAADEAELLEPAAASASPSLVAGVLTLLERPGYVHRAFGSSSASPSFNPGSTMRRPGRPSTRTVVIDGRSFAYALSGTQVQVIGLLGGHVRAGTDVTVMLRGEVHPTIRVELGQLVDEVEFVEPERIGRPEIFHKPHQFWSFHDLAECLCIGERLVLTQLDMILERTPAYRDQRAKWDKQRATTAAALSSSDQIGFLSRHAALDAASDGGLELDRATVVHCGVDHLLGRPVPEPARPLGGRPYLLVVGNAFWHKNRLFAIRLLRWLVDRHGWDGGLVLAGGHPRDGSSVPAEQTLLQRNASLVHRVSDRGYVSESERLALFAGAKLVLFPSMYEGFGFIPFEAAALGTACAYAHRSSMSELLPAAGALPSFDLDDAGRFVFGLLDSSAARTNVVEEIRTAARSLTWDRTAEGYLEVYERALGREPRGVSRGLLSLVPGPEKVLKTRSEVDLVNVYRRRRGVRLVLDSILGASRRALRGARHVSGWQHRRP